MQTLDYLEKLLGFDTTSTNPNMALITWCGEVLTGFGADVQIIPNDDATKANLYATIGPKDIPGVMLSGHTDVVPVAGQDWTVPPFQMTRKNGRIYGRGATDMKGFVACALAAAGQAATRTLKTPLHLGFSYDEEIGCIGVRSMIDMLASAPIRPAMCIVGEPTSLRVATGHKGKTAVRVTCRGKEGHSALAPFALNALHLACDFVGVLRAVQDDLRQGAGQDPDYDVAYTTIHVGRINGGGPLNIVPNHCELDFEIRNLAGDDPLMILDQLRNAANDIVRQTNMPEAAIEFDIFNTYPGLGTDKSAPVVDFVKSLNGANGTCKVAFGTEGGLFDQVLGIPTVVCGPGSMDQGHKPDEYITMDQLEQCDAMLVNLVSRLETGV